MITDFQNSPLSLQLRKEGRTTCVPYPLLDNTFAMNVRLKNYTPVDFYDRAIALMEHSWSPTALARRFAANRRVAAKIINIGRGLTEGRGRLRHHRVIRRQLGEDPEFAQFAAGESAKPPRFYFEAIRKQLGRYQEWVPPELLTPDGFLRSEERVRAASAAA
jgi:hypothetical protein